MMIPQFPYSSSYSKQEMQASSAIVVNSLLPNLRGGNPKHVGTLRVFLSSLPFGPGCSAEEAEKGPSRSWELLMWKRTFR